MATAPERPQPLHNFFLSQLRWGHNSTANHRFRRRDSPRSRDDPPHTHPNDTGNRHRSVSDGGSDSEARPELPPTGSQPRFSPSPCSAEKQRPPTPREAKAAESQRTEQNGVVVIPEEGETRTWNLRPRKASITASLRNGEMQETGSGVEKNHNHMPKSQRLRGIVEGVQGHQWLEKKRKLWISLSKEEIEEDVYSLTGSRPARRPKKRPRNVQKLVNDSRLTPIELTNHRCRFDMENVAEFLIVLQRCLYRLETLTICYIDASIGGFKTLLEAGLETVLSSPEVVVSSCFGRRPSSPNKSLSRAASEND